MAIYFNLKMTRPQNFYQGGGVVLTDNYCGFEYNSTTGMRYKGPYANLQYNYSNFRYYNKSTNVLTDRSESNIGQSVVENKYIYIPSREALRNGDQNNRIVIYFSIPSTFAYNMSIGDGILNGTGGGSPYLSLPRNGSTANASIIRRMYNNIDTDDNPLMFEKLYAGQDKITALYANGNFTSSATAEEQEMINNSFLTKSDEITGNNYILKIEFDPIFSTINDSYDYEFVIDIKYGYAPQQLNITDPSLPNQFTSGYKQNLFFGVFDKSNGDTSITLSDDTVRMFFSNTDLNITNITVEGLINSSSNNANEPIFYPTWLNNANYKPEILVNHFNGSDNVFSSLGWYVYTTNSYKLDINDVENPPRRLEVNNNSNTFYLALNSNERQKANVFVFNLVTKSSQPFNTRKIRIIKAY
jgi:hypothetical protein